MNPEKKNNAEDKPPVLKEEAIALAEAGDLPGALAAANAIEDTEERAAALEAIASATAEKEQAPPVVDVAKKRRNTNIGVGIGVLLQVGGLFIAQMASTVADAGLPFLDLIMNSHLGLVLILVSLPPFIWGCMNYAEAKGYSKEVGLIGLLGFIGLIVLIVLPDKLRDGPEARMFARKICGLVLMALGLGLFMVGYVLEEAVFGGDRYSNGGFGESLIVLGLILLIVSLVMLLYNRKRTQPKETHPEDAHEGET